MSLGNAGNSLDGQLQNGAGQNEDEEVLAATWHSTTQPLKPLSHDRLYYFLPIWDDKAIVSNYITQYSTYSS